MLETLCCREILVLFFQHLVQKNSANIDKTHSKSAYYIGLKNKLTECVFWCFSGTSFESSQVNVFCCRVFFDFIPPGGMSEAFPVGVHLILLYFIRISLLTPETFFLFGGWRVEGTTHFGSLNLLIIIWYIL